jgi:hypothetical protein
VVDARRNRNPGNPVRERHSSLVLAEPVENLDEYILGKILLLHPPQSARKWCKTCGGHLMTEHPSLRLVDVFAGIVPGLEFKPREHLHYQETVLHIVDSLPKNKDLPKSAGGSGVLLPS